MKNHSPADMHVLRTDDVQLVIHACHGSPARIIYWGEALAHTEPAMLAVLSTRQHVLGCEDIDIQPTLANELGVGFSGSPGIIAHREGLDWACVFRVVNVEQNSEHDLLISCEDSNTALRVDYRLSLNPATSVLEVKTQFTNLGHSSVTLERCAVLCMPLSPSLSQIVGLSGRWAGEFQTEMVSAFRGSYVRENNSGRTSHATFPGLIACAAGTNQSLGEVVGFHLGWSGNHFSRVDRTYDGSAIVQLGEAFFPGEMRLDTAKSYASPVLYIGHATRGLNQMSQRFHRHLIDHVMDDRTKGRPRLVHFNTWEAVYFNHSENRLMALADVAASVGAERFVLDDGWFGGRRSDEAGLGDWVVSDEVFPNGLLLLAQHVRQLDMEFGVWFEPEMVNPNSDLYRTHPNWILQAPGVEQVPFRNQYALDLTRPDVSEYLFDKVDKLIRELGVTYIKWDMNRVIHHPGSFGRSAIHFQTKAVYALMQRLRDAHLGLEIESCASGGGRADYGVLRYSDRIWTSDNNDAMRRQGIQSGASYYFPL